VALHPLTSGRWPDATRVRARARQVIDQRDDSLEERAAPTAA
jgi:hypothetical protein